VVVDRAVHAAAFLVGRRRTTELRTVVEAILYLDTTGCQWRQLPKEFPPYSTVQGYFYAWSQNGTFVAINQALVTASRENVGREASPTAGVIDSQSVKTTESGGPSGYDAAKKIKGRKRHIVTDTQGHLIGLHVHTANIQDRDGAIVLIQAVAKDYPKLLSTSLLTAPMPVSICARLWRGLAHGTSRSSGAPTR